LPRFSAIMSPPPMPARAARPKKGPTELSRRIREALDERGISGLEAARQMKLGVNRIDLIVSGQVQRPHDDTLLIIARFFGWPYRTVLSWVGLGEPDQVASPRDAHRIVQEAVWRAGYPAGLRHLIESALTLHEDQYKGLREQFLEAARRLVEMEQITNRYANLPAPDRFLEMLGHLLDEVIPDPNADAEEPAPCNSEAPRGEHA
jgi:hypothetical protein